MAYATIHNDDAELQVVGGFILQPQQTVSLTESDYFKMVEDHGAVDNIANIVVTITEPSGLASDAEVEAIVGLKSNLTTTAKGTIVAAVNEVKVVADAALTDAEVDAVVAGVAGALLDLDTTDKATLVAAINELRAEIHDTGTGILDRLNAVEGA
jgi:hypothetical protein